MITFEPTKQFQAGAYDESGNYVPSQDEKDLWTAQGNTIKQQVKNDFLKKRKSFKEGSYDSTGNYTPTQDEKDLWTAQGKAIRAFIAKANAPKPPQVPAALSNQPKPMADPLKESFQDIGSLVTDTINNIGGGIAHGGLSTLAALGNIPHDIAPGMFGKINVPEAPFVNQRSPLYQSADVGVRLIPAVRGFGLASKAIERGAPALNATLRNALAGGATGFGLSDDGFGSRILGALAGGAAMGFPGAVRAVGPALQSIKNIIGGGAREGSLLDKVATAINPNILNNRSSDFYNSLSQGMDKNALNTLNTQKLKNEFLKNQLGSEARYSEFLKSAEEAGYSPSLKVSQQPIMQGERHIGTRTNVEGGKHIQLSSDTRNLLKDLLKGKNADLHPMDSDTLSQINKFKNNPSLENTHLLQSRLGSRGYELTHPNSSDIERTTGKLYGKAKDLLLQDISKTLENNGDIGLMEKLRGAREFYKENIVPYKEAEGVRDIVNPRRGNVPDDVLKVLSKNTVEDLTPKSVGSGARKTNPFEKIRQDFMRDPENRRTLLAQGMADNLEGEVGNKATKLKNVMSSYNKTPDILKKMAHPGDIDRINALNQMRKDANSLRIKGGIGSGVGLGLIALPSIFHKVLANPELYASAIPEL